MSNLRFVTLLLMAHASVAIGWQCVLADESDKLAEPLPPAASKQVDFVKDVQPIFQQACIRCHGDEKQKGDYRLDIRESALTAGESYAPNIIAGKSAESPLIKFVAGGGDLVMPPEGKRLSRDDVSVLRAWIDQGAHWPDSASGKVRDKKDLWSLKPLIKPAVPTVPNSTLEFSPIDAFIRAKLAERKFPSSSEADRRTLIRRVYFDLIGLPPTPDEVQSFVADTDVKAYEKLIDRLLDSPRYGERWARHWMDAAHFAETHGNDQDRIREHAWPFRDYLIAAFNADKPYSRFIQEQIAADALFPDDTSVTAALGFLAAGPWDESALRDIREDTLDRQIARYLDRDDMLSTVINNVSSMTVQCARCHDHKFDPISQRDYYSLQAIFSGVERANRRYDTDPEIRKRRAELTRRKSDLDQRSPTEMAALLAPEVQKQVAEWEQQHVSHGVEWHVVDADTYTSSDGATLTKLPDQSILSGGTRPDKDIVTITTGPLTASSPFKTGAKDPATETASGKRQRHFGRLTAIRLEVLTDDSLPQHGPGRQDNGNFHLSEFEVFVEGRETPLVLVNPTADFDQSGWEIAKTIDQKDETAWGIHPKVGVSHQAFFELKEPLTVNETVDPAAKIADESADRPAMRLRIVLKQLHGRSHLIGRMRLSITDAVAPVRVNVYPDSIATILATATETRTDEQRQELARYHQLNEVDRGLSALPKPSMVYAAASDFEPDGSMHPPKGPRQIHLLHRGDIRNPRDECLPGALSCVSDLNSQFEIPTGSPESTRRVALAKWLTDNNNVLTWRSIVNRVWHHHFGRGLVMTLNDFGHMGETPSHPELLDWLAVEFRDGGQSLKKLHRQILTSQTYRQSVEIPARNQNQLIPNPPETDPTALDADNRLLWRMNRTRLDAESVRDAVLAISGRLDLRMGGPSDRQFDLKPGIHVTPSVDYSKFDQNSDLGRRRSVYRFLFRTLPDPFMESLDCPSGDAITPARGTSVTIQQALALWNDSFIASHCEHIASRITHDIAQQSKDATERQSTPSSEIELAVRLILCRRPTDAEKQEFLEYTTRHGLANLCRLLLNCNEFLFVN